MQDILLYLFFFHNRLYFANSGLQTRLNLLNNGRVWWTLAVLIVLASVSKIIPVTLATKFCSKRPWFYCLSMGVLMNTRGIVQLVVLNIGVSLGVISPIIFAMFVLMATILTFMTSPILYFLYHRNSDLRKLSLISVNHDLPGVQNDPLNVNHKDQPKDELPTVSNGDFIPHVSKRDSIFSSKSSHRRATVVELGKEMSHPTVGLNPLEIEDPQLDEFEGFSPKTLRRSIVMTRF